MYFLPLFLSAAGWRVLGWRALAACSLVWLLSGTARAQNSPIGTPGLTADYYRGYFYDSLGFFTTRAPAIANRPVEQLNFVEAETDNFGVGSAATYYAPGNPDEFSGYFRGQFYAFAPGQYTFYLGSDDAASLWLDGAPEPVARNQGDQFPYRETRGSCFLSPGLHTLQVFYGEHGGSQGLVLEYSGPSLPRQLVPNGVLYSQYAAVICPTLSQWQAVAGATQQQVTLSWRTAAEENSDAFVLQRSVDGVTFRDVQRLAGAGTSAMPHSYQVVDTQPPVGTAYYRLQQLRSDRPVVYSPITAVEVVAVPLTVSVYPVPNNGSFYVQVPPTSATPAQLELRDIAGHVTYRQQLQLSSGQPQYIQPGQAVGIYRLYLTTDTIQFSQKISLGY